MSFVDEVVFPKKRYPRNAPKETEIMIQPLYVMNMSLVGYPESDTNKNREAHSASEAEGRIHECSMRERERERERERAE